MHFVKIRKSQYDNFKLSKSLYFRDFQVFTNNKFFFPVSNKFYTTYNEKFPPFETKLKSLFSGMLIETEVRPESPRKNFVQTSTDCD